jgi:CDGSH iron-sulfur domain-containing protein 3
MHLKIRIMNDETIKQSINRIKIKGILNMEKGQIAGKKPIAVDVKAGETYHWCACGKSSSQPFCNGAHQGTSFAPIAFKPEKDEKVYFCTCKQTKNPPFCDGTHNSLED